MQLKRRRWCNMKRALSDLMLPNYWDLLEDGIGPQLERSRKFFLRGGRFS